ncbi:SpoIVB peptidase [Feifania hominis]|uniref:SpoIVB peptidase n=1 Tax=Feifania hominis TaxID=2763660 RepID=A0A926DA13_9FIRM|nr:SpoIVB peptidase [Feifania hominis]MBC8535150.1 SpoIVB peptidase [Feifania hominis]
MTKFFAFFLVLCTVITPLLLYQSVRSSVPDSIAIFQGNRLNETIAPVVLETASEGENPFDTVGQQVMQAKLFGVVPIKEVSVSVLKRTTLIPSGSTFGVKLFTNGVMVVGMSDIHTADGDKNPAYLAGIRVRDIILEMNGVRVSTIEEVASCFENGAGTPVKLKVSRQDTVFETELVPVLCSDDSKYKVGLWVRDSTAGIGTMTFVDPENRVFAGLGHGICDVDTGDIMPLYSGSVVKAQIMDVNRGEKGAPGELIGTFDESVVIGSLLGNSETGIYGIIENEQYAQGEAMVAASSDEIHEGPATILTTVDGDQPQEYEIQITKVMRGSGTTSKNMMIKVTDEELLKKTGGIVQGMSGSPILQDGKLIGAVTHVLVNDPTKGYGIFIENMIEEIRQIKTQNQS